ncbi:MAG: arylsulfatase [Bacteroidota bacterium]
MNRLLTIFLLTFAACQPTHTQDASAEGTPKPPNIIYILADDLGYADLGCYGQTRFSTPNLDRMAAEGIRFTQHYAGSTVCAPSRSALMTGLHAGHGRVRGNYESGPHGFGAGYELGPDDKTMAEYLQEAGYATGLVGKWGLGVNATTGRPNLKGFDSFYGFLNQGHAHKQFPEYLYRDTVKETIPENLDGQRGRYTGDIFTEEALTFIQQHQAAPFFLYLSYSTPHAELLVPDDSLFDRFRGKYEEVPYVNARPPRFGSYDSQAEPFAAYASMVYRMDRDVQKILDQLKVLGLDENTVVMFSSDNGPHREGGSSPEYFDSNGPLRGMKRDLYDGGIRVPMIMRWPGGGQQNVVSDHVSAFWDILPTCLDLAGIDQEYVQTDGVSFAPLLRGEVQNQSAHHYLYWEFHEAKSSHQAIRKQQWKALRFHPEGPIELYDVEEDAGEMNNVAADFPEVVAQMHAILDTVRTPHSIWSLKTGD